MREISNPTRLNTGTDNDSQSESFESVVKDIIRLANSKVKLISVLSQRNIHFNRQNQYQEWSASIKCPFPAHKNGNENTGSFGYNFLKDVFYCFGCGKGGQAVEFLANLDRIDPIIIAEQIIKDNGGYDIDDLIPEDNNPKIDGLIFEFSNYVNETIRANRDKLDQIEKVTWWFDLYLAARVPKNKVLVEELEARINKAKELLERLKKI